MRHLTHQRGAVVVEMAIVLIPLLILAFGVTEYGRAMYQYNMIAKSVRDSARHLSQYAPGDATRIAEAKCLAVYGNVDCTLPALASGLTTSQVYVLDRSTDATYSLQSTGRGSVNLVAVEVRGFTFISVAPAFVPNFEFDTIYSTMTQVL